MTDRHAILVPSRMLQRLKDRVAQEFEPVYVDRLEPDAIAPEDRARIVGFAGWGHIGPDLIDALPNLRIIANFGVGYDGVDASHAASKGVMVTNTPDVLTDEVADVTIGLLLNTLRELPRAETYLREGKWRREGPYPLTGLTLRGRTAGIYGLGRIGEAIARRLEAFDIPVSYHSRSQKPDVPYPYHGTLADLADAVDTLIVAVPGSPETEKSVDADILRRLGGTGVLINIGRGSVVDEEALIEALRDRTIAAAGLDVFADEPNVPAELLGLDNACLLPHVASASVATRNAMADLAADNLLSWFQRGVALTPVPECRRVSA